MFKSELVFVTILVLSSASALGTTNEWNYNAMGADWELGVCAVNTN